jgi:hypothetical protein
MLVLWHDYWMRVFDVMTDRVTGPFRFRLYLQPTMATILAIRAGLMDARAGRSPYFWTMMSDGSRRLRMAREGWRSVGKVFILAMILDIVFQIIVVHTVYPLGVVFVAFVLAILPYLILRGIVTRVARHFIHKRGSTLP